jgi:hypothetical protein
MISESEKKIGNCERVFDIARIKLEKIVIAIEEEVALHGAPSQKLLYDLSDCNGGIFGSDRRIKFRVSAARFKATAAPLTAGGELFGAVP